MEFSFQMIVETYTHHTISDLPKPTQVAEIAKRSCYAPTRGIFEYVFVFQLASIGDAPMRTSSLVIMHQLS